MTISKKKIFFIIGPTSSGKTSLSIKLAKEIGNAEIISADSRQVYRDFDLSSGKVTSEEMENIPHHLLDVVNPGEYFSVVDFTKLALEKIDEIYQRGNIPIVCGGTGFYIDSLLYEYDLPPVPVNQDLRNKLADKKPEELFKILKKVYLNNIFKKIKYLFLGDEFLQKYNQPDFKKNKHRMSRVIEVVSHLGYLPKLVKKERFPRDRYEVEIISTNVDRESLKQKINTRLIQRIESGMIEEIKNAKEKYHLSFEYLEGLGLEFKWVARYLQEKATKEEMIENLEKEIYQFARRQESWFRRYRNN
jgi:tRNA dimethylallyltransferase